MKYAIAALLLLLPAAARAEPVSAHYAAYARGLNAVRFDAEFDVTPQRYRVRLLFRTTGTVGSMFRAQSEAISEGRFVAGRPAPTRFFSHGTFRGDQRVTQIDYQSARPSVRQMVPANDAEREPVPPEAQVGTVDSLSVMAQLVLLVNTTGRCEGSARTFDGRRLSEVSARTVGQDTLAPESRSSYAGPALKCEFQGRQTGGFALDADRAALARPQQGFAWFAATTPGGPMVPVRIVFPTRLAGDITVYIANRDG